MVGQTSGMFAAGCRSSCLLYRLSDRGVFRLRFAAKASIYIFRYTDAARLSGRAKTLIGEPMKRYKWVVEFTVDATWVEDGFNLTDEQAQEMIEHRLGYAYSHEVTGKVISSPAQADILKCQGYTPATMSKEEIKAALA